MNKDTLKKTFKATEATVAALAEQLSTLLVPQRDAWSPAPCDHSTETALSNTMSNKTACSRSPNKKRTSSPLGSIRDQKSRARTNIRRADLYSSKWLTAVDKPTSGVETAAGISSRSGSREIQMRTAVGSNSTTSTAREDSRASGMDTAAELSSKPGKTALGVSSRSNSRGSCCKSGGMKTALGTNSRSGSRDSSIGKPTTGVKTAVGLSSKSARASQKTVGTNSGSRASQMSTAIESNSATSTARENSQKGKTQTPLGISNRNNSRGSCVKSGSRVSRKKKTVGIKSKGQLRSGMRKAVGQSSKSASRKRNRSAVRARSASRDSGKPTTGVSTALGMSSRSGSQVSMAREQTSSSPPLLKIIQTTSMSRTPITSTSLSTARDIPVDIAWTTPSRLGNTTTSSSTSSKEQQLAVEKMTDGRIKVTMMLEITAPSGRIGIAAQAPEGTKVKMVTVNGTKIFSA